MNDKTNQVALSVMDNEIAIPENRIPITQAANLMIAITQLAADPSTDLVKINGLMDLHERMMSAEAKKSYARDFVVMKAEMPRVIKQKENKQTHSKYAPLEDINNAIDPILTKYGFGTQTKILEQSENGVKVEATLLHRDGHSESNVIFMPLDGAGFKGGANKTDVQAIASSVTYAKRVAICALLNVSTGDDIDGNHKTESSKLITLDQAVEIDLLITETAPDKKKFLDILNTDSVQNILAKDYARALNILNERKEKLKKATVKNPTTQG